MTEAHPDCWAIFGRKQLRIVLPFGDRRLLVREDLPTVYALLPMGVDVLSTVRKAARLAV